MEEIYDLLKQLVDPESIIKIGGISLLLFVIFAETGLFVGFFLPGDSLVFIAGIFCVSHPEIMDVNIIELELLMISAAVAGNVVGYWFGHRMGKRLYKRKDSFFFKKRHLETTKSYYDQNGRNTIIIGRFLPIIRTFAPIVAGIIKMDFKKFMIYNTLGAILWIGTFTTLGYYFGNIPWVQNNIGIIVIALIIITLIPLLKVYFSRGKNK